MSEQRFREASAGYTWGPDLLSKAFARPTGVAIDRKTAILYVVNSGNNSVGQIKLSERKTP